MNYATEYATTDSDTLPKDYTLVSGQVFFDSLVLFCYSNIIIYIYVCVRAFVCESATL